MVSVGSRSANAFRISIIHTSAKNTIKLTKLYVFHAVAPALSRKAAS